MRLGRRAVLAATAGWGLGCAPAEPPPRAAPPARAPIAAAIATSLIGARTCGLYHVHRARYSSSGELIRILNGVGPFFDFAGLDVRQDIQRAFAAAPDSRSVQSIVVLQHLLDQTRIAAAFAALRAATNGVAIEGVPSVRYPMLYASLGGSTRVVAAPAPGLVVIAPEELGEELDRFQDSGALPEPEGREACMLYAEAPAETVPDFPFPASLAHARVTATLDDEGGAVVAFDALSSSNAQAATDARALEQAAADATTLDLLLVDLELIGPFPFTADGAWVRGRLRLSRDELSWLSEMALRTTPGARGNRPRA